MSDLKLQIQALRQIEGLAVVVIRIPPQDHPQMHHEVFVSMAKTIHQELNVPVLAVPPGVEVEAIDAVTMERAGWRRAQDA